MKFFYYIIYFFSYIYTILPLRVLYILSDIMYYPVYYILRYRRKQTRKNLLNAFPDKKLPEIIQIEKGFYHHFCDYIFETIKVLHISDKEMMQRFKFNNIDAINKLTDEGRSVLLMLGHYGNWEWVTSITLWTKPNDNLEIGQIYRPLKNKAFDEFFLKLRKRFHSIGIAKNDTLRSIVRIRREKKQFLLGFISDQKPSLKNMHYWTTFLNQDTSVLTGAERIAHQANACVAFLNVERTKRGYYESKIEIITVDPQSTEEFEITEKYIRMMEKNILRNPTYWLWTHNRWKYKKEDIV